MSAGRLPGLYEMSIGAGRWELWREGEPFAQRFSATIGDDGETISGRWEKAADGLRWETDFDLAYRKLGGGGRSSGTLLRPRRSRKSAEAVTTDSRPVSPCRSQQRAWRRHGHQHPDPEGRTYRHLRRDGQADGLRFDTFTASNTESAQGPSREVAQVFHVEKDSSNIIFGTYHPETVFFPTSNIEIDPYVSLRAPYEIPAGSTYSVISRVPNASPDQLRSAGTTYPEEITTKYTQLPHPASTAPAPSPPGSPRARPTPTTPC